MAIEGAVGIASSASRATSVRLSLRMYSKAGITSRLGTLSAVVMTFETPRAESHLDADLGRVTRVGLTWVFGGVECLGLSSVGVPLSLGVRIRVLLVPALPLRLLGLLCSLRTTARLVLAAAACGGAGGGLIGGRGAGSSALPPVGCDLVRRPIPATWHNQGKLGTNSVQAQERSGALKSHHPSGATDGHWAISRRHPQACSAKSHGPPSLDSR